jgi:hypothetical protein
MLEEGGPYLRISPKSEEECMKARLSEALKDLPPIMPRTKVPELLCGLISKGHLQNLDCEGKGPRRVTIGRKVCYTREDLISWLAGRAKEGLIHTDSAQRPFAEVRGMLENPESPDVPCQSCKLHETVPLVQERGKKTDCPALSSKKYVEE